MAFPLEPWGRGAFDPTKNSHGIEENSAQNLRALPDPGASAANLHRQYVRGGRLGPVGSPGKLRLCYIRAPAETR